MLAIVTRCFQSCYCLRIFLNLYPLTVQACSPGHTPHLDGMYRNEFKGLLVY